MEILFVTGMSGAGKSIAVHALEDIGYFCVDNIPPNLLLPVIEEYCENINYYSKIAIIIDVRAGLTFDKFKTNIDLVKSKGIDFKLLFIDCDDEVLIRRYKETRRSHPLMKSGIASVPLAIIKEREMLVQLKDISDIIVDSTYLKSAQFRERIKDYFTSKPEDSFSLRFVSFGYKHGLPRDADIVFDVRCFINPFYVPKLKEKTGLDKEVSDYVMNDDKSKEWVDLTTKMFLMLLPQYKSEGKSNLVIAFGCTGGHHRSVTFAEYYYKMFSDMGYKTSVDHRDINK